MFQDDKRLSADQTVGIYLVPISTPLHAVAILAIFPVCQLAVMNAELSI